MESEKRRGSEAKEGVREEEKMERRKRGRDLTLGKMERRDGDGEERAEDGEITKRK